MVRELLGELPLNALPTPQIKQPGKMPTSQVLTASATKLPDSEGSEEGLEDFSSGDEVAAKAPAQVAAPQQHSKLRRLAKNQASSRGSLSPDDDLLAGFSNLVLGSGPRPAAPSGSGALPAKPTSAIAATATSSYTSAAGAAAAAAATSGQGRAGRQVGAPAAAVLVPAFVAGREEQGDDEEEEDLDDSDSQDEDPAQEPGALVLRSAVDPGRKPYVLAAGVACRLYPHQVVGVRWLWSLYDMQRGGILGDDMGLGKTMQCAAFLAGLLGSGLARRALIIAPKTLLPHWAKELRVCGLAGLTKEYFGSSVAERNAALRANPKMKLVEQLRKLPARVRVIISGTPIQNNLMEMHSLFDFTTEGLLGDARAFKTNYERPITKGLDKEATARERQTGAAIAAALRRCAGARALAGLPLGRRCKRDVLTGKGDDDKAAGGEGGKAHEGGAQDAAAAGPSTSGSGTAAAAGGGGAQARAQSLPRKNDLVVWLRLTPLQRKIYTAFLHTDSVRQVLSHTASPLAAITVLKKICDHPALLSANAATSVIRGAHRWANDAKGGKAKAAGKATGHRRTSLDDFILRRAAHRARLSFLAVALADDLTGNLTAEWLSDEAGGGGDVSSASLHAELARELEQRGAEASCKSAFVLALLGRLAAAGHRTLIFSQSKVMLSILEAGVRAMDLEYCRIDGDVDDRQAHVARFQNSKTIPVFLLTSQVGGLGLTLTAADRVIIVDPAWNPSIDNQSVDRAYRMGQTRDVVVYRLITCGTVEEKIYRKQVFKGGLSRTGTEEGIQFRYFTQTELKDLFSVSSEGLRTSSTQQQLDGLHRHQRNATQQMEAHLAEVMRMEGVAGIHDHDLLFSQRPQEVAPTAQEGDKILSQMSRGASGGAAGVDALADMLGAGMRLGGAGTAAGVAATMAALKERAAFDAARRKVDELQAKIRSIERSSNITFMPDGGKRAALALLQALG
eukprot:XP_001702928.1 SWI/SNF chromatin remodeling complex component [Chlamydomonas reinhardtii]